jgi:hypothetical protein
MVSFTHTPDLHSQLQQCQQQKMQVEQAMQSKPKSPRGTVDFDLYRLKKEKSQLQERITKINSILHPDIIA